MNSEYPNPQPPRKKRAGGLIALAFFVFIVFLVVKEEVPQVSDWIDSMIEPARSAARQACEQAALSAARQRDYARIVDRGKTDPTEKGFYIHDVVVGEMGATGKEVYYRFSCYADTEGTVVNSYKETMEPEAPKQTPPRQ
jgi:hypothetical protein